VHKIKEVLHPKHACSLSDWKTAQSCNMARSTIANYLARRFQELLAMPNNVSDCRRPRSAR